ncbi:MAG: Crp/Fnr family transcriptional regulator [Bacteroidetes bacterium]|nr:Crp/Fnr family transcriptional regulator [Bacteroidota bacterium]
MKVFLDALKQISPLSEKAIEAFSEMTKEEELSKGHLLIKAGTVCNYIYFIEAGLSRTFYYKDGKDVTDWISAEGSFAASVVSFITRQPDIRNVELLEPSRICAISYANLEKLYADYHEIERLGRLLVSYGLVQLQNRFDDLHFASAQERYMKLMNTQPSLINRVPLGMIASYLGITQETLSRIRAKV